MNRRTFLNLLAATSIAGSESAVARPAAAGSGKKNRWLWLHHYANWSQADWQAACEKLSAAGFRGLMVQLYNGHHAYWPSKFLPVGGETWQRVLPAARRAGLEVHAWMFTMMCNDPAIRKAHPEWFIVNRKGESCLDKPAYVGYYKWLCPNRAGAMDWLMRRVEELAALDGLTGVHLDYIRYPDVILPDALQPKYGLIQDREYPEFDYCYCEACRATAGKIDFSQLQDMETERGEPVRVPPVLPAALRRQHITQVVQRASKIVRAAGKQITAAVFATPALAQKYVRQDWTTWPLDRVFPMIYHNFYAQNVNWIGEATRQGVKGLSGSAPLTTGVFLPSLSGPELARAEKLAHQQGSDGICLFSWSGLQAEHWQVLQA